MVSKTASATKLPYANDLQFPMSLRKNVFKRRSLPSRTTISRCRLAKVQSYEFLSDILVCARHFSFMWDLTQRQSREKDISRPMWNPTRSTQNNMV
jgi:hypothetical protein